MCWFDQSSQRNCAGAVFRICFIVQTFFPQLRCMYQCWLRKVAWTWEPDSKHEVHSEDDWAYYETIKTSKSKNCTLLQLTWFGLTFSSNASAFHRNFFRKFNVVFQVQFNNTSLYPNLRTLNLRAHMQRASNSQRKSIRKRKSEPPQTAHVELHVEH